MTVLTLLCWPQLMHSVRFKKLKSAEVVANNVYKEYRYPYLAYTGGGVKVFKFYELLHSHPVFCIKHGWLYKMFLQKFTLRSSDWIRLSVYLQTGGS